MVHEIKGNITVISYTGEKVKDLIPHIAALRIEVFVEYPFLYQGNLNNEKHYLSKFQTMKNAIVVAAFDGEALIGISTGYPFIYEAPHLQDVLRSAHRNPEEYFCFGESVLRKSYRGRGIGGEFFNQREAHVRRLNRYKQICFYTIMRPPNDPRRPADYRPLGPFWERRGYQEHPELVGSIAYQEIGEAKETPKNMVFWMKEV